MQVYFGVEYYPDESEGEQFQELDPLDFIRLVQSSPESNVELCYETGRMTFLDEYGAYYNKESTK